MSSMAAHVVFPATAAHMYHHHHHHHHHQKEKTGSTHSPTNKLQGAHRLCYVTTDSRKPWRVYNNLSTADDDGNYRFSRETENSSHLNSYSSSGSKESEESGEESEEDERRIYVGNLAWACTSDELSEHLQGAGTVELVEVCSNLNKTPENAPLIFLYSAKMAHIFPYFLEYLPPPL